MLEASLKVTVEPTGYRNEDMSRLCYLAHTFSFKLVACQTPISSLQDSRYLSARSPLLVLNRVVDTGWGH